MINTETVLRTYVGDMLALERELLQPLQNHLKDDKVQQSAEAAPVLREAEQVVRAHIERLEQRLKNIGGNGGVDGGSAVKSGVASVVGGISSAIQGMRKTGEVSKYLRDDYSALCMDSAAYSMLHTTALGIHDNETARLAEQHLNDIAKLVMRIGTALPKVVVKELRAEGVNIDESVAQQAVGNIQNTWRQGSGAGEASSQGSSGFGDGSSI